MTGVSAQTQVVFSGTYAARARSTGTPTYAIATLGHDASTVTYEARLRVESQVKNRNATLLAVRTSSGAPVVTLYRTGNGRLGLRNHVTSTNTNSNVSVPLRAWHRVMLRVVVGGAQGRTEVSLNGTSIPALTKDVSTGLTPIRKVQIAETASSTSHDFYFDDVSVVFT